MSEKQETWRDIIGYEGLYQVSNWGRVKRLAGTNASYKRERILKSFRGGKINYQYVQLSKDNIARKKQVHRLVAEAFLGDIGGMEINHKDANPANNNADNLEIVTHSENVKHTVFLRRHVFGEKSTAAKLTSDDVRQIRHLAECGYPYSYIETQFNVSRNHIIQITKRNKWSHIEGGVSEKHNAGQLISIEVLQRAWDYLSEHSMAGACLVNYADMQLNLNKADGAVRRLVGRLHSMGCIKWHKRILRVEIITRPTIDILASWYSEKKSQRRAARELKAAA